MVRLQRWLDENGLNLEGASYSDSLNDLPLLEKVSRPVAVDPDPRLRAEAEKNAAGRSFPCVDPLTSAPSDGRRHGGPRMPHTAPPLPARCGRS